MNQAAHNTPQQPQPGHLLNASADSISPATGSPTQSLSPSLDDLETTSSEPSATLTPAALAPGIRQTRLIEKAIRERWPITDKMRESILKRQYLIAINSNSSPREATSAARAVISASAQNLEVTKMELAEAQASQEAQPQLHLHMNANGQRSYRPPIRNVIVNRPAPVEVDSSATVAPSASE